MRIFANSNGYFVLTCSQLSANDMFSSPDLLLLIRCSSEKLGFYPTFRCISSLDFTPFSNLIMSESHSRGGGNSSAQKYPYSFTHKDLYIVLGQFFDRKNLWGSILKGVWTLERLQILAVNFINDVFSNIIFKNDF